MNILYIAPMVPYPLIDGDRQRAFHLLKALTNEHKVHLLCFVRSKQDEQALKQLEPYCCSVHGLPIKKWEIVFNSLLGWFSQKPLNVLAFQKMAMHKMVKKLINQYQINAIHAYRLRMGQYALKTEGVYRVLDYTDSMLRYFQNRKEKNKSLLKSFYINHEVKRLKKYESPISDYLDGCIISSPSDKQVVLDNSSAPWIDVVTNGVDVNQFVLKDKKGKAPIVLFVANMNYVPNKEGLKWFCKHCWPRIVGKHHSAKLHIVGQPPKGMANGKHADFPEAIFLGLVEHLETAFDEATIAICPVSIASGRQFKVIEYFAAGLPTVTTSLVAKNLDAQAGKQVLIGDSAEEFAQQVNRLIEDNELAKLLSIGGRQLAEEQYDWSMIGKQLNLVYHKLESAAQVKDGSKPGTTIEKMKSRQVLRIRRKV